MANRKSWDRFFLGLARMYARRSKDPSTKCGAVIVNGANGVISGGYNGFARGSRADVTKVTRAEKLKRTAHAEQNSVFNAARHGIGLEGCSIYVVSTNPEYGLPCAACALAITQSGITQCVVANTNYPKRWAKDTHIMVETFRECGVILRKADSPTCLQHKEQLHAC